MRALIELLKEADIVVTNPPYKKMDTGLINENKQKLISRHEYKCNLEDIIETSSKLLKDNGFFYMVHRPERLVDISVLMRKYKIEPKEIRNVYSKEGAKPTPIKALSLDITFRLSYFAFYLKLYHIQQLKFFHWMCEHKLIYSSFVLNE